MPRKSRTSSPRKSERKENFMSVKVQVVFYSMYGHVFKMAEAVVAGAKQVPGAEVSLYQVTELVPDEVLEKYGAKAARATFAHVPFAKVEQLPEADAIIFGTPTRFGNMAAQMRNFLDQTGPLWMRGALVGKLGSVFCSTASQHGGQETTITSFHTTLLHHGMIIVGLPYTFKDLSTMREVTGGTPYGASCVTGAGAELRMPTELELKMCRFQGEHVATISQSLVRGRAAA